MIEMTDLQVETRIEEPGKDATALDGESLFSSSLSSLGFKEGTYVSQEPILKTEFMLLYGFDPTTNNQGLSRFNFIEEFGFDPMFPRRLEIDEDEPSQILVVDEDS